MHDTIAVAEIMVADVVTAPLEAIATDAAVQLHEERVSSVVVTDDGSPVGIITEGTFATELCHRSDLGETPLADVMSAPLETVSPDASIVDAVEQLRDDEIEHLPVVDGSGDLSGIVTTTELTYYVPHLIHQRRSSDADRPPNRQVRTDTTYERDDWTFTYHGSDESSVDVGDVARFSKTISDGDIDAFAEVTGDTNRVHLEEAYAAETRFGERIVHGVLANGIVSAALARLPGLTIYLSQKSSFLAPLSVGDRATAECAVTEALGGSKYRIDTTVTDGSETVVLEGDAVVLIDELPDAAPLEGASRKD
ncbi:CBS domain-containing protein [Salinadaptatus halalkaliphilus]|uniref:CBS domain-containing protein n=1 Tax=Salinadaptatus halalkaliphilus TaxID=2419781 RepID=A0A4S3THD5_9EURY|nr:CBS domain-containing protein [Salinadaptatus halalkaliphilus]THE63414.1 CBS domain-containing protein [Salinadaptatus halalkaliphilus]